MIHLCKLVHLVPKSTYFSARMTKSGVFWHHPPHCNAANWEGGAAAGQRDAICFTQRGEPPRPTIDCVYLRQHVIIIR